MSKTSIRRRRSGRVSKPGDPPGKTKLIGALRHLLEERDFNSITTAEIANAAETNEALIYRYFGDKRGLLHRVLAEYLQQMLDRIDAHCESIEDPVEQLEAFIWETFDIYGKHRVFAKIVLFEVRCFHGYFKSEAYQLVRQFAHQFYDTIALCIENGEFRSDLPTRQIRDSIIGMIEHLAMHDVISGKTIDPDQYTRTVSETVLNGLLTRKSSPKKAVKASETGKVLALQ